MSLNSKFLQISEGKVLKNVNETINQLWFQLSSDHYKSRSHQWKFTRKQKSMTENVYIWRRNKKGRKSERTELVQMKVNLEEKRITERIIRRAQTLKTKRRKKIRFHPFHNTTEQMAFQNKNLRKI